MKKLCLILLSGWLSLLLFNFKFKLLIDFSDFFNLLYELSILDLTFLILIGYFADLINLFVHLVELFPKLISLILLHP